MYVAEYLPRLSQISIKIDFPHETKLISAIGIRQNNLVIQASSLVSMPLPVHDVKFLNLAQIAGLRILNGILSLQINIELAATVPEETSFMSLAKSDTQKWSVKDLAKKTPKNDHNVNQFSFCCSGCELPIIKSTENKFMDMPSEFWHEMMDFWHCHKPHEHHHLVNDKNYNGKLLPGPGSVHIGASYLLVAGGLEKCSGCGKTLGVVEGKCVRLYKWNLKLKYGKIIECFPPYAFVFYLLLDKINSSAIRKVSVRSVTESVNVWVSNLGLDVSVTDLSLTNALKILYIDSDNLEEEILDVPSEVFQSFKECVEDINSRLPQGSKMVTMLDNEAPAENHVSYLLAE